MLVLDPSMLIAVAALITSFSALVWAVRRKPYAGSRCATAKFLRKTSPAQSLVQLSKAILPSVKRARTMARGQYLFVTAAAAMAFSAMPAQAQDSTAQAAPAAPAVPATTTSASVDPAVATYYALRPGAQVWFRDADTRTAAMKLPTILKRATTDGLAEGPALAAQVEAAIARGQPADEQVISDAWVKFVKTLQRAVEGIDYGDTAVEMKPQTAEKILIAASRAPSLSQFVDQTAAVNPFYASLRDDAEKSGTLDDPRVKATLDRLRLVPGKGRAIVVDVANAQLMMLEEGQVVDTI
jgi:hypothetical protein